MKISGFQNYKIANKILVSMLAVTITVGITPSFSFANQNSVQVSVLDVEDDKEPQVVWKYKSSEENCIYVYLKDDVALDKILDKNGRDRVTFKMGTNEVVARYELEKEELQNPNAEFIVQDMAGKKTTVKISEVSLDVSRAYKNENGDMIALNLKDEINGISKVTYLDGTEIENIALNLKGDENNVKHEMNSYEIDAGTTAVKVYQKVEPETFAVVMLELDWQAPEILRLYKNDANTRMIIKAMDNDSGIEKILLDGEEMNIEGYSREIFEQLARGITKVEIYDAVGHITEVEVETNSTKPMTRVEKVYDDNGEVIEGKYKLIMKAPKAGLWKLVKEDEEGQPEELVSYDKVTEYNELEEKYPLTEQMYTIEQVTGVVKFKVYDAVGNVAVVDLENINCVVIYAHNNKDGNKIAVSLYDDKEITKLGILNDAKRESIIEQFKEGTKVLRKWYDTPKGTTGVKVYYKDEEKPAEIVLEQYDETPIVVGSKVYSLVGISKIDYKDEEGNKIGKSVEFKENMPTRVEVDLTNCNSAVVYDSLNNSVEVTK